MKTKHEKKQGSRDAAASKRAPNRHGEDSVNEEGATADDALDAGKAGDREVWYQPESGQPGPREPAPKTADDDDDKDDKDEDEADG